MKNVYHTKFQSHAVFGG